MTKEQVMREWILRQVGCGYIYGATGWVCSPSRRKAQAEQYPDYADVIMGTGAKWDGRVCFDCAQLTRRAMEQVGLKPPSGATSQYKNTALYQSGGTVDQLPAGKLAQLFRVSADGSVPHTGWAIGDGTTVDARGHKDGVIRMAIDRYPWTHYKLIVGAEEEVMGAKPEIPDTSDPGTDTNAGTSLSDYAVVLQPVRLRKTMDTSSSSNVIRQLGIGDQLTVLAVTTKGKEVWAHLEQTIGKVTHRGWACVEDSKTRYISLPGVATVVPEEKDDEQMESLPIDREALRREFEANTARNLSIFKILYD